MASSKRHCKNPFSNFPCDLPLSPWIFRKISGYHDKHRDQFYSKWTKTSAWPFTPWASLVWNKMLAAPGGAAQHRDTHLTTDVIYCHMHKDGSLFYALQVHVSVTWNRGSRAGTRLGQEEQLEIFLLSAAEKIKQVCPSSSSSSQWGSITLHTHSGVAEPHHLQTSPHFLSWFHKPALSCFIQALLLLLSSHDLSLTTFSSLDF